MFYEHGAALRGEALGNRTCSMNMDIRRSLSAPDSHLVDTLARHTHKHTTRTHPTLFSCLHPLELSVPYLCLFLSLGLYLCLRLSVFIFNHIPFLLLPLPPLSTHSFPSPSPSPPAPLPRIVAPTWRRHQLTPCWLSGTAARAYHARTRTRCT